jgi:hypothetical protein
MKKIIFLVTTITSLFLTSCSSDSENKCTPIPCLNGGVSNANCGCDCPQGFTGTNCTQQIPPSKISITKIVVKTFPNFKPDGSNWDSFTTASLPEIFPVISTITGEAVYFSPIYYDNAVSTSLTTYEFIISPSVSITNLNQGFVLGLWDYDGSNSNPELMSTANFNIYSNSGGFPNIITVNQPLTGFSADVYVNYEW